jgi:hypothetical protein
VLKYIFGVFLLASLAVPVPTHAAVNLCSCVRFVASLIPSAPLIDARWYATVFKERTYPAVGRIAMFKYGEKVTESHVAIVKKIEDDGFWVEEANWKPCKKTTRFIKWSDENLVGFLDLGTPRKVFALR